MLRRRLLIMLAMMLLLLLALAGYKGFAVYRQMQLLGAPRIPVSVVVATVKEMPVANAGSQTVIPESAIAYTLSGNSVYVVIDASGSKDQPRHVAERRSIDTGDYRDGQVVVLSGLEAGERIVTAGQSALSNGALVSIAPERALQLSPAALNN